MRPLFAALARLCAFALMCFGLMAWPRPAAAHQPGDVWNPPTTLLKTPLRDGFNMPVVFTGPSGNTYAFYSGRPADDPTGLIAIYFMRWTSQGWTQPVDVIALGVDANPSNIAAVEDGRGYLHVFWPGLDVMRASAPAASAQSPSAWSEPQAIGNAASPVFVDAKLSPNNPGLIHIVASDRERLLRYVSMDADGNASQESIVREITDADAYPFNLNVVETKSGVLNVCWVEQQQGFDTRSRGYFCSVSADKGSSWSVAQEVASGHRGGRLFYFSKTNTLARMIWGGNGVGGRSIELSMDEGRSWSSPVDLAQSQYMEGFTGQELVEDGAGMLHAILNPGDGRYVYLSRSNGAWSSPQPIGYEGSDWVSTAVARGNTLVAIWSMPGAAQVSSVKLAAPEQTPAPLPTLRPTSTAAPKPTAKQTAPATPSPLGKDSPTASFRADANVSILAGVISAAAVGLVGILVWLTRKTPR